MQPAMEADRRECGMLVLQTIARKKLPLSFFEDGMVQALMIPAPLDASLQP